MLWYIKRGKKSSELCPGDREIHSPNTVHGLQTLVHNQVWKAIPICDRSLQESSTSSPAVTLQYYQNICCFSLCRVFSKISYFGYCLLFHWGWVSCFLLQHSLYITYFLYCMLSVLILWWYMLGNKMVGKGGQHILPFHIYYWCFIQNIFNEASDKK